MPIQHSTLASEYKPLVLSYKVLYGLASEYLHGLPISDRINSSVLKGYVGSLPHLHTGEMRGVSLKFIFF